MESARQICRRLRECIKGDLDNGSRRVRRDALQGGEILHRREGDSLPDPGEGDLGLFCLSRHAYLELLPKYSNDVVTGHSTRERNFLPFIPWLTGRAPLVTFPACDRIESVGINDVADLQQIEQYWSHEREALNNHSRL